MDDWSDAVAADLLPESFTSTYGDTLEYSYTDNNKKDKVFKRWKALPSASGLRG